MWIIIRFIVRFFQDLWRATLFAVVEYDDTLKLTKTPQERFVIWAMVGLFTIIGFVILVMLVRHALATLRITGI